MTDQEYDVL